MENRRILLFFIVSLLIVQAFMFYMSSKKARQQAKAPQPQPTPAAVAPGEQTPPPPSATTPTTPTTTIAAAPTSPTAPAEAAPAPTLNREAAPRQLVRTRSYEVEISRQGAVPVRWDIIDKRYVPKFDPKAPENKGVQPTDRVQQLIDPAIAFREADSHPFEIVLREYNASFFSEFNSMLYTVEQTTDSQGRAVLRFTSPATPAGLRLVKTYVFPRDGFVVEFGMQLVNQGSQEMRFSNDVGGVERGLGLQLGPGLGVHTAKSAVAGGMESVDALLMANDELIYRTLKDSDDNEDFVARPIQWGGLQSLYFMAALIPAANQQLSSARTYLDSTLPSQILENKFQSFYPSFELYGPAFKLSPGDTASLNFQLFMGPKQHNILEAAGHDLERVLFYKGWGGPTWSWMRALCVGMLRLMAWFHHLVGSWGVAIILLTVVARLITFPLVHKSMKSQTKMMAEQAKLKPLIDKINQKYKDDPQRKQQEIFKLYREHGVNPFGMFKGCIWIIVQLPIFYALFRILGQSIELRGAPFLWITDLSLPDRLFMLNFSLPLLGREFNILPFITAGSQMLVSKFMTKAQASAATDPQQRQMMLMNVYFMPLFILFITYHFSSGLMLYCLISNLWQVVQQYWVNKIIKRPDTPGPRTVDVKAKA